jgi:hypothetical protein
MHKMRRLPLLAVPVAILLVNAAPPTRVGASPAFTTVWVSQPLCGAPRAGHASCMALRLVQKKVKSGTPLPAGARVKRSAPPLALTGPAGGFTPAALATLYGVNPDTATTQTVALVDAFDDPTVLSDLNTFDAQNGLPAETGTSFTVVNQNGAPSPLPAPNSGWAGEITLGVQTVRGICHKCKILLVESDDDTSANLAAGVNRAVAMGAKIVSNEYGMPETDPSAEQVSNAYNHAGVAILAATGDDGWYDWDFFNSAQASSNQPLIPAALRTVVAVSGTSAYANPDGTRAGETVWNSNGPADVWGSNLRLSLGAAGGGCSTLSSSSLFQRSVAGYAGLGCGTNRSATDIAAVGDPFTGLDVFETYPAATGSFETVGGTSLSTPVIAALWAIAGGPNGVAYPALSLYGHWKSDAGAHDYDVTIGGTGLCSTASPTACSLAAGGNPNTLGGGLLDCGFGPTGTAVLSNRYQCYARPGYDGVSGVGTPKGVGAFTAMVPRPAIANPGVVTHGVTKVFSSAGTTDPFPGGTITSYAWNFGDGVTATGAAPGHRYARAGARTITLTVVDNYARTARTTRVIAVR